MSLFDQASLVVTPNGVKEGKLYSIKPTDGSGDLNVVRATTATRVNSEGLIESVSANVPRLDYTNGSCPSILVEPQRTNVLTYSEDFSNANWIKSNSTSVLSNIISPNGGLNAYEVEGLDGGAGVFQIITVSTNTEYTFSFYARRSDSSNAYYRVYSNTNATNIVNTTSYYDEINSVEWKRVSVTFNSGTSTSIRVYVCSIIGGAIVWGAQLEAGSYATSYIPTVSSAVTRNADVISKTGISDLIGQTEGTMFVEHIYNTETTNNVGVDDIVIGFSNGTLNNLLLIIHYGSGVNSFNNKLRLYIRNAGADQALIDLAGTTTGTYKIAVAYKNNDVAFYVNGVQVGIDTSVSVPTLSNLYLYDFLSTNTKYNTDKVKSAAIWKERLSNETLATLTTI